MDFILAENALTTAEIRRQLAAHKTVGVRVGDMDALLSTVAELWLIQEPQHDWEHQLRNAALNLDGAFWQRSLHADEVGTIKQVSQSLAFALDHLELGQSLASIETPENRFDRYFNDLVLLHDAMGHALPCPQALANDWFQQYQAPPIEPLRIHCHEEPDSLLPWQQQLVTQLQALNEGLPESSQAAVIEKVLADTPSNSTEPLSSIAKFTNKLFHPEHPTVALEHLHWLSCRDAIQEVEAVTALIQNALNQGTAAEQIAVVVPQGGDYAAQLEVRLHKAGILLSNISGTNRIWDWQSALLHDLLQHHLNPLVPMASMSVLINPLMPWSTARGHRFAEQIQKNKEPASEDPETQELLELLFKTEVTSDPESLMEWLRAIIQYCDTRNELTLTQGRMEDLLAELASLLKSYRYQDPTNYVGRALAQLQVGEIPIDTEATRLLNAVTLVREDTRLPFPVSELFLAGFNQGHYQYQDAASGAIPRERWEALTDKTALRIPSLDQEQQKWKLRFRQLLSRAEQRITFTLAQHDYEGTKLEPSESLVDMALCFMEPDYLKPETLLTPVDSFAHPLLEPEVITPQPAPRPNLQDLTLNTDLLNAKDQNRDKPLPESPSSLERLMLSPLLWVLDRFHLKSRQWEPLKADPAVQGSIAHHVFELYAQNPEQDWSEERFDSWFEQAVHKEAEFLNLPDWEFNRRQLRQQVREALQSFMGWCQQTGWTLAQAEVQLQGSLWGISVSGWADAILERDQDILVLDYKKSKHDDHLKRLNKGYDLQTYIYRSLYSQTHGSASILSGYFAMNDCHLVSDHPLKEVPGVHAAQPKLPLDKQSEQATDLIQQRLQDLRKGTVPLNSEGDAKSWKDAGVKTYALTESGETPLNNRFTRPDTESAK